MRKLLLATTVLAAFASAPASAAVLGNLGPNPTSAGGNFQNAPGLGAFEDQVQFQLVGAQVITIASVTNTFANGINDFIANFTAAIWNYGPDDLFKTADDFTVIGPVAATANCGASCQGMGGSATLAGGLYYAELTGIAGSTAGYAGNLSTAPIPLPGAAWLFLTGIAGLGVLARRRKQTA